MGAASDGDGRLVGGRLVDIFIYGVVQYPRLGHLLKLIMLLGPYAAWYIRVGWYSYLDARRHRLTGADPR